MYSPCPVDKANKKLYAKANSAMMNNVAMNNIFNE
jgi:hypothetical protein